ncbi:hypothetical protein DPMN_032918 [Dreissena polymorpha]|uniref:Uncharacterized protein n=1 Tax=Dreissena polymorpha TaxID=45954 RepID=A0A9D4M4W0_DREPO|nr:hypothetical protein DPMN_032918 [Dreissena polymorpha]
MVPGSKGAEKRLRSLGDGLFVKGSVNEVPVNLHNRYGGIENHHPYESVPQDAGW